MNYKIKHLQFFLEGKFDLVPKSLGVELVELGIVSYSKLTPENYDYWWYEVKDKSTIDKKKFTFNWLDLAPTRKTEMVKEFIQYHREDESMYRLITAILNIDSARSDGTDVNTRVSEFERQIDFYYGKFKSQTVQMQFEFNCL
jgi:disulfide oxidoreductase YuzD